MKSVSQQEGVVKVVQGRDQINVSVSSSSKQSDSDKLKNLGSLSPIGMRSVDFDGFLVLDSVASELFGLLFFDLFDFGFHRWLLLGLWLGF